MRSDRAGSGVAGVAAALDVLAAADVAGLTDAAVQAEVAGLVEASHRVHAELARRVEVFDRRGLARIDGLRSTRAWLQSFTRISGVLAHRLVKQSRLLARLPRLARAAGSGAVSAEHVGLVARLVDQLGRGGRAGGGDGITAVEPVEAVLAEAAQALDPGSFAMVCDRVRAHVDPDGPDPQQAFASRGLSLHPVDGSLLLRGQLDAEGGATLSTALDAVMAPPVDGDERTASQRRADALVELARRSLTAGSLPTVGGQRPQVGVLLFPQALSPELLAKLAEAHRGTPAGQHFADYAAPTATYPPGATRIPTRASTVAQGGAAQSAQSAQSASQEPAGAEPAETGPPGPGRWRQPAWSDPPFLDHIGAVSPTVAQRIACDADVWRLILDPASGVPLDVGRSHRLVPYWIRKALSARDRGCRFPGCHTPAAWTDAHHLIPWAEGGTTSIDNCVLLCRHHHGLVHEGGWHIRLCPDTGEVTVTRPGGIPYLIWTSATEGPAGGGASGAGGGGRGAGGGRSRPWNGPATQAA